jgi:hypothetical protein
MDQLVTCVVYNNNHFQELLLFATKLAGLRINACFEPLSRVLFSTCRGEKFEQHKRAYLQYIYTMHGNTHVLINEKNPLLGVGALCARMQTSLHTSPVLSINCPVSHKLLAPTTALVIPLNKIHLHLCYISC